MRTLLALFFTLLLANAQYRPFLSFSSAKHGVQRLYSDHKILALSHEAFIYTKHSCSLKAFTEAGYKPVDWYHIIPEKILGKDLACMTEKLCRTHFEKRPYAGMRCCQEQLSWVHQAQSDLFLIVPMKTSLFNQLKHSYLRPYSDNRYPKTHFMSFNLPVATTQKGEIARTLLYATTRYPIQLSAHDRALLRAWHKKYPVTAWEIKKNAKIFALQGTSNPFIKKLSYNHKK